MKSLGEKSHKYRLMRFGMERTTYLKKYIGNKKNINLLDIGCSTGFFIEAAIKEGWKCEGLELNPSAASFGNKRGLIDFGPGLDSLDEPTLARLTTGVDNLRGALGRSRATDQAALDSAFQAVALNN